MAPIIFGNFGGRTTKTPAMWTPFLRVSLLLFAGCTQEVEIPKPDIQLEACFRDEAEACLGAAYELRRAGATDWELVDYLEKIGTRFGADLNAYTSFDETVYQLKIPTDDPEIFTTAFHNSSPAWISRNINRT